MDKTIQEIRERWDIITDDRLSEENKIVLLANFALEFVPDMLDKIGSDAKVIAWGGLWKRACKHWYANALWHHKYSSGKKTLELRVRIMEQKDELVEADEFLQQYKDALSEEEDDNERLEERIAELAQVAEEHRGRYMNWQNDVFGGSEEYWKGRRDEAGYFRDELRKVKDG